MDAEIAAALEARWSSEDERIRAGTTWVDEALRPLLAAAARSDQLRNLFPFTSMNRLCFSRCSDYPYTMDCPCIAVAEARFTVQATWAVSDEPAETLAETTNADEAIAVVEANLPSDRQVWLGTASL
jgi:Family of unknown function (DUF6193)